MSFADLGLSAPILEAVTEAGYKNPTEIQAKAIPIILEKKDVIGASQTGTGKTAAFALPSLSLIKPLGKPQILVLEPTRELADQVAEQFEVYGKHTGCKVALLYGGRLMDHYYKSTMRFRDIKVLSLDEVDRMLDMGFLPIVKKIVKVCPWEERQTLFFSATMPPAIASFAEWCLNDPQTIEIARREVAKTVKHAFYPVSIDQRDDILLELLKRNTFQSLMIFTRTRKEADTVCSKLNKEEKLKVTAMHSDIKQKDRMAALKGFKDGTYNILVATDVAARGIDVSGVSHVINYRVPENPEDYVHRIGRTGRAETEGDAFTILTADELEFADAVEKFVNQKIERRKLENFNYVYTALLDDSPAKPVRKKRPPAPKRRRR